MSNQKSDARPELVIGLVGAAGTRLDDLSNALKEALQGFGYSCDDVRLSDLLANSADWAKPGAKGEFERITNLQETGNRLRARLRDGAALARAGITEIRQKRMIRTGKPDSPAPANAYVIRQLKHPAEVDLLRKVYGPSFVLVAGHAPKHVRVADLAHLMAQKASKPGQDAAFRADAEKVVNKDEKEEDQFGQNTRDTYPKADFFANLGLPQGERDVSRFVELLFGHPFRTPRPEEFAMYQASAAALRSSDYSRQVGAVIVSLSLGIHDKVKNVDVIAVGMNEVPRGGGGYYWENDSPDTRDQALLRRGEDRATEIKISALIELLERIKSKKWLSDTLETSDADDLARALLPDLKRTQFMDIGEFSRPVHAELSAIIDAARRGVPVDGRSMYVTTFPCHNCIKHIIAAGLQKVIYLEPYPKSRGSFLYNEELALESIDGKEQEGKVVFASFTGIAPRQYRQLFSMSERGTKQGRSLKEWESSRLSAVPLHTPRNASLTYLAEERDALRTLDHAAYRWDEGVVCP